MTAVIAADAAQRLPATSGNIWWEVLQAVGDPHLDDGLARHAEPLGFTVECLDHPMGSQR